MHINDIVGLVFYVAFALGIASLTLGPFLLIKYGCGPRKNSG